MTRSYAVVFVVCCLLAAGGCDIISPKPAGQTPGTSPGAVATPTPIPALAPVATTSPQPSPSPSPTSPPAFVTPIPPAEDVAWTGIAWRKLAADDPLGQVRSWLRWRGGYVAVGAPVATGDSSHTPVWVSADGGTWRQLDADVLGPATIVLGVGSTAEGIVALTLQGRKNQCDGGDRLSCWAMTTPLQAWTSSDGATWVAHPGPDIDLRDEGGVDIEPPIVKAGTRGLIVLDWEEKGSHAAISEDGVSWDIMPAGQFSTQIGFSDDNVAAFRSGFVAVSEASDRDTVKAVALTSPDGRHWTSRTLPRKGFAPGWIPAGYGTTAGELAVGSSGLIAIGGVASAPGAGLWWSSLDGRTWKPLPKFPPLGIWFGNRQGSGITPNGTIVGNGERILAYRSVGKGAAWTSFNGRSWQRIAISGKRPTGWPDPAHFVPTLVLMPMGVPWVGADGSTWFGDAGT
jgi:hypothetical protein